MRIQIDFNDEPDSRDWIVFLALAYLVLFEGDISISSISAIEPNER
jgi:hypothetical protein